jgi:hypothetical protein
MDSQTLPVEIRNNYPLHKILFSMVKTLLLNELEIVYLSLFVDKFGWLTQGYGLEDNLLLTGLSVKVKYVINI